MPGLDGTFVLIDADADALAFARERLDRGWTAAAGSCRAACRASSARCGPPAPFHLVVGGGLFDYLPDRWAVATLQRRPRTCCLPGGTLLFSNIAAGNPFRTWIEYLADWRLIERDEGQRRCG